MTFDTFEELLDRRLEAIRSTLATKASEYAKSDDRLHNFKRAAAIQDETPAEALVGMWSKHLVSVLDIVDAYGLGQHTPSAVIDEKLGDAINYLILLEAILKE